MKGSTWLLLGMLLLWPAASVCQERPEVLSIDQIVARMVSQGQMQEKALQGYRAARRMEASNPRFGLRAAIDLMTTFHRPDSLNSEVVRFEGSNFIRKRVFDKILEAEKEASAQKATSENDILPQNYQFELQSEEDCSGHKCYRVNISPRRNSKYLLKGSIWIDAEDYAIVRITGSPSKRVSFWTLRTEVDRQYQKVNGIWLLVRTNANSDLLIAGRSVLSITYDYSEVLVENAGATAALHPGVAETNAEPVASEAAPLPSSALLVPETHRLTARGH